MDDELIARLSTIIEQAIRDYFERPVCGICGSAAVFDNGLDINLCPRCGAIETEKGWQAP